MNVTPPTAAITRYRAAAAAPDSIDAETWRAIAAEVRAELVARDDLMAEGPEIEEVIAEYNRAESYSLRRYNRMTIPAAPRSRATSPLDVGWGTGPAEITAYGERCAGPEGWS